MSATRKKENKSSKGKKGLRGSRKSQSRTTVFQGRYVLVADSEKKGIAKCVLGDGANFKDWRGGGPLTSGQFF